MYFSYMSDSLLLSSASVSSPEASAKVFSGSVDFSDLLPDFCYIFMNNNNYDDVGNTHRYSYVSYAWA